MKTILTTLFSFLLMPCWSIAEAAINPVKVSFNADPKAISPGGSVKLGVHFEISTGWHIYGKNAGDSGLPTKIKFTVPQGFSVSDIDWPEVERFESAGNIVTFGYSKPVTLPVTLSAAANAAIGESVKIEANVSWLNCSETLCIPEKQKLSLDLPVEEVHAALSADMAPPFSLTDQNGKTVALSDFAGKIVVLEWTNPDCPFVKRHHKAGTMEKLAQKFSTQNVVWLGINSTYFMTAKNNQAFVEQYKLTYPVLLDSEGSVGKAYGAKTTPYMVVIDQHGKIAYRGAIDDDPSGDNEGQAQNYVEQSVQAILNMKPIEVAETKSYGCSVKYRS